MLDDIDYDIEYLDIEDEMLDDTSGIPETYNSENSSIGRTSTSLPTKKKTKHSLITRTLNGRRFEFESALLDSVFEKTPLFDYTIPIKERAPSIVNKLWEEVCSELSAKFDVHIETNLVKDLYKKLRNSYTRYKNLKEKTASGSSSTNINPEPKHIDKLRRLDTVLIKRAYVLIT